MKSAAIPHPDPIMNLPEAAAYLGMSRTSLYRLVWSESIEFARIGRVLKFRRSALDAMVAANTHRPEGR